MDNKERLNILSQLAQTDSDAAQKALENEAKRIKELLNSETEYNSLEEALELLEVFARRTADEAFEIVLLLLKRLETVEPTHVSVEGFPDDEIKRYHNGNTLITKTIGVLGVILLFDPELDRKILDLLLDCSVKKDSSVRKAAQEKLHILASYHMGIWNIKAPNGNLVGPAPQQNILDYLKTFADEKRKKYFSSLITVCDAILEPTIDATQWDYNKVSISTASIPAADVMNVLRSDALLMLKSLYLLAETADRKKEVVNTLQSATRTPSNAPYKKDLLSLIAANTVTALTILLELLPAETDLLIVQHIEHVAYWKHKLAYNEDVRAATLKIKAVLDANNEYQIFKVLIGWEGIFNEWKLPPKSDAEAHKIEASDIELAQRLRDQKVMEYANSVGESNFEEWKNRILNWSQIRSNDMAMFPAFAKFLEQMSKKVPSLSLNLLEEHADKLDVFIPFVLSPTLTADCKARALQLAAGWISSGKYLWQLSRIYEFNTSWDASLLRALITKALGCADKPALRNVISVFVSNYSHERKDLINEFIPLIMRQLTQLDDPHWVSGIWFRREMTDFVGDLEEPGIDALLENLVLIKSIDYQVEAVLTAVAKKAPEKIFDFIGARLEKEAKKKRQLEYDAVPYQFHTLQNELSQYPDVAIEAVSKWFDGNYGMFVHRGAQFLHNVFPDFSELFAEKLIEMVKTEEYDKLLIALATLRNYRGNESTYETCLEIIKLLPKDSSELSEIAAILESTGVVSGEYGLAEAYEHKKQSAQVWLKDKDEKVIAFAEKYISMLDKRIEWARSQADEELALRKYRYGSEDNA